MVCNNIPLHIRSKVNKVPMVIFDTNSIRCFFQPEKVQLDSYQTLTGLYNNIWNPDSLTKQGKAVYICNQHEPGLGWSVVTWFQWLCILTVLIISCDICATNSLIMFKCTRRLEKLHCKHNQRLRSLRTVPSRMIDTPF